MIDVDKAVLDYLHSDAMMNFRLGPLKIVGDRVSDLTKNFLGAGE
jgi:hypothetical protein